MQSYRKQQLRGEMHLVGRGGNITNITLAFELTPYKMLKASGAFYCNWRNLDFYVMVFQYFVIGILPLDRLQMQSEFILLALLRSP